MAPIRKIYILALAVVLTGAFSLSALSQQTKESDTNNQFGGVPTLSSDTMALLGGSPV